MKRVRIKQGYMIVIDLMRWLAFKVFLSSKILQLSIAKVFSCFYAIICATGWKAAPINIFRNIQQPNIALSGISSWDNHGLEQLAITWLKWSVEQVRPSTAEIICLAWLRFLFLKVVLINGCHCICISWVNIYVRMLLFSIKRQLVFPLISVFVSSFLHQFERP